MMKLSPELDTLEKVFQKHNLYALLVGGGARAYLATGLIADDIDLEIRSKTTSTLDDYLQRLETAFAEAAQTLKLHLEPLAFSVMRLRSKTFEVECAPARLDLYDAQMQSFGHKDFSAKMLISPNDEEAFLRRDFTVNALGIELTTGRVADPFQGQQDLAQKILRTKNPDFKKDPLRFLRAFRFATTLNLSIDQELENQLKKMDLTRLEMDFYFREAFKKRGGERFLQKTFNFLHQEKMQVHQSVRPWFFLKEISQFSSSITPQNFWAELALNHSEQLKPLLTHESLKSIEKNLGIKKKILLGYVDFAQCFLSWSVSDLEELKSMSFEKFQKHSKLRELEILLNDCSSFAWEERIHAYSSKLLLLQKIRALAEFLKTFKIDYQAFPDDLKLRGARKLHTALQSFS